MRVDGRQNDQLREIRFELGFVKNSLGSALLSLWSDRSYLYGQHKRWNSRLENQQVQVVG